MEDLGSVFTFAAHCIRDYLLMMNSYWITQIILYTVVLGFVVSTILIMRGGK